MPKIEIDSTELERSVHQVLLETIRDLYPQGFEYFYPTPPDLEQIVTDAIRYRHLRMRMGQEYRTGGDLDRDIDRRINEEHD